MSEPLIPCPSCNRHVFTNACVCPFCAATLHVCGAARVASPNPRLSRAARLAAGAALAGVTACGGSAPKPPYGAPPPYDASLDSPVDADAADVVPRADGLVDATPPSDASEDRAIGPIYGAAAPTPIKPVR